MKLLPYCSSKERLYFNEKIHGLQSRVDRVRGGVRGRARATVTSTAVEKAVRKARERFGEPTSQIRMKAGEGGGHRRRSAKGGTNTRALRQTAATRRQEYICSKLYTLLLLLLLFHYTRTSPEALSPHAHVHTPTSFSPLAGKADAHRQKSQKKDPSSTKTIHTRSHAGSAAQQIAVVTPPTVTNNFQVFDRAEPEPGVRWGGGDEETGGRIPFQPLCVKNSLHSRNIHTASWAGLDQNRHAPQEVNLGR